MELELIPAQTGNGTINCKINLSVDTRSPKREDMQLLIDQVALAKNVVYQDNVKEENGDGDDNNNLTQPTKANFLKSNLDRTLLSTR